VVFEAEGGSSFQSSLMGQMSPMNEDMSDGLGGFDTGFSSGFTNDLSSDITALNGAPGGVAVTGVIADQSAPLRRYDPQHPDAGPDGFVAYPDINPLTEMTDLMGATRSYGMNASAVQAEKNMVGSSLDILK
jgi:flagellar basal-body rod protein FlgC